MAASVLANSGRNMPEQFHFIQPLWLLALLPLAVLLWQLSRHSDTSNPWRKIVDSRLLPLLMSNQQQGKNNLPLWLLAIGWLVAVLALADPSWEQLPQPLMQTSTSRVIVLDLSRSMLAADLQPSRLLRARFKVEDILAHDDEGQTGLVVFAGDRIQRHPLNPRCRHHPRPVKGTGTGHHADPGQPCRPGTAQGSRNYCNRRAWQALR